MRKTKILPVANKRKSAVPGTKAGDRGIRQECSTSREREFRTMLQTSMDGFWITDMSGNILDVNDSYCHMIGYSRKELLKMKITDVEASETSDEIAEHIQKLNKAGSDRFETRHRRRDGKIIDIEISTNKMEVPDTRFYVFIRDITARKRAEQKLLRSKKNLEARYNARTADLIKVNEKLGKEISGRKNIEYHITATNELLKLFSQTLLRQQYLDRLVILLQKWCDCDCIGIRLVDETGKIPYSSYIGFNREIWGQDDCLSLKKEECLCPRVIAGRPEPSEAPFMTPGGSFICNNISRSLPEMTKGGKGRYRDACVRHRFLSLAIIPIRHRRKRVGAIHFADRREGKVPLHRIEFIESMTPLIGEALYRFYIEEALMGSRQQLRNLSAHLLAAREEERTKVAREIHDELGQGLAAASLEVSRLKGIFKDQKRIIGRILAVSELIDNAVNDVQRICSELRPTVLDHLGLLPAIEWQAKKFSRLSGISCFLDIPANHIRLPAVVSTALFRILQETLTNVSRHAGATETFVSLAIDKKSILMEIQDNGRGITKQEVSGKNSFGIMGIHERVHELDGTVAFRGVKNRGTTIRVEVPLNKGREGP